LTYKVPIFKEITVYYKYGEQSIDVETFLRFHLFSLFVYDVFYYSNVFYKKSLSYYSMQKLKILSRSTLVTTRWYDTVFLSRVY